MRTSENKQGTLATLAGAARSFLNAKLALPTTWLLIMMSTRYVPTTSALAAKLYTY